MKTRGVTKWALVCVVLVFSLVFAGVSQAEALWSDRFERTLGKGAVSEIVKQYGGEYIPPIWERMWLEEVFGRLVAVTERDEIEYSLLVLNSFEYNAFALPGGYTFITRGLLQLIGKDATKLAAVLGHEIAHVEKRHGINAVLRQMGLAVLMEMGVMWFDVLPPELLRVASATLLELLKRGWGREAEYEADLVGQTLAVRAGFDGIGVVALLDDLAEIDPNELPTHIFSSHPDTSSRRRRVAENLGSFWRAPEPVTKKTAAEMLEISRNLGQNKRTDPKDRYEISLPDSVTKSGLSVYDRQRQETTVWLEESSVYEFGWSPTGEYMAVLVREGSQLQLWLCDRYGYAVKEWSPHEKYGSLIGFTWSPAGEMIALAFSGPSGNLVVITYIDSEVYIPISGDGGESALLWLEDGLYFERNGAWYRSRPPHVEQVSISNPVPLVLQRKRLLSPTVIREEGSIRLTRPSLTLP